MRALSRASWRSLAMKNQGRFEQASMHTNANAMPLKDAHGKPLSVCDTRTPVDPGKPGENGQFHFAKIEGKGSSLGSGTGSFSADAMNLLF